jgi:hypothetical protein
VGAFKAGKTFVPRIGLVSAGVVGREDPAGGNPPPRAFAGFGGEPALLVTEQDTIMKKWCPLSGFAGNPGHLRTIAPIRAAAPAFATCCIACFSRAWTTT